MNIVISSEEEDETNDNMEFMNRSLNSSVNINELQLTSRRPAPKRGMKAFNQIRQTGVFSFDHHLGSAKLG